MKLKNSMLVVTDIEKSVEFYKKIFGLHIIMDLSLIHIWNRTCFLADSFNIYIRLCQRC